MLRDFSRTIRLFLTVAALALSSNSFAAEVAAASAAPMPVLVQPEGHQFKLLKNWTFGNKRADATIHNKSELDQEFFYRYIWENGKLDKFKTYWSYHRDYPEGDPKSLHVFSDNALTLKGRIPPGGGLHDRGIESGMLRGKLPVTPGMYIEMRAKLPGGVGVWPSFWLEEGVQNPDGTFSKPPKALPEIDIFEFFNWDGRPETRILTGNIQTFGGKEAYGNPHDLFTTFKDIGWEKHLDLGFDCSKDFHVFALDWIENKPVWLVDGKPIKQTYYEWHGPPAHVTVVDAIGMNLDHVKQTQMVADEKQWDYTIDYIRVWEHTKLPNPEAGYPAGSNPPAHELTLQSSGKWQNPIIVGDASAAAKLKAHPILKADISIPPETEDSWFEAKLAIQADGFERAEAPQWLLDRVPGKAGIDHATLSWDTTALVAKLPEKPKWFKIELVIQGGKSRTVYVDNVRFEGGDGAPVVQNVKPPPPVVTLATPYPDNEKDFPGKGPARKFPYMQGERDAFFKAREKDKGAIVFVGDSLTGGWKNLAKDFPDLKVANRGVGGDTSRNVLFRFKEDVLVLNPKAIVIEVGNNDLTAMGKPADTLSNVTDMLALIRQAQPDLPVILCSIPPSANPKAPVKAADRKTINDGLKKLTSEQKNLTFCDLYAALANDDGSPKPEYFGADKLHPSDAGHSKWAELVKPIFKELKLQ